MIENTYEIFIVGTTQDGGYPHIGCNLECCQDAWNNPGLKRYASSIAVVNNQNKKYFLIDVTPDVSEQLHMFYSVYGNSYSLSGIFLTHAHVGHYMGLFKLGLEMMNSNKIPLYAMPEMMKFLKDNSSTNFLFESNNIADNIIKEKQLIELDANLSISPFYVPHRNELSETVGYKIKSDDKSVIYIPDVDSWEECDFNILDMVSQNDYLFLDGTFYDKSELYTRDISKIPHPSIIDSIKTFKSLSNDNKSKIFFTHLNHTNNLLRKDSDEYKTVIEKKYNILHEKQKFLL